MNDDCEILDYYHDPEAKDQSYASIDSFADRGGAYCDLGRFSDPECLLEETMVVKDERGCGFMVAKDGSRSEIIVSVTGILVEADLPPYKDQKSLYRTRPSRKDVPVNRVSIAWFGHEGYDKCRIALENIRSHFSLKYDAIDKVPLPVKCGAPIVSCENRVVSKVDHVPAGVRDVPLAKNVDPKDVIKNQLLCGPRYRYVPDNVVTFARMTSPDDNGEFEAKDCGPEELKVGFVVCVQATPTIIPTTRGGAKLVLKLRNILVVDDALYKKYIFQARQSAVECQPKPGSSLKRSAGPPQWVSSKRKVSDMGDVRTIQQADKQRQGCDVREPDADGIREALSRCGIREQRADAGEGSAQSGPAS